VSYSPAKDTSPNTSWGAHIAESQPQRTSIAEPSTPTLVIQISRLRIQLDRDSFRDLDIMAKGKVKKQPSHYPVLPFHLIRLAQLLSSMVVSGIMFYFIYHLTHGSYKVPWTFLLVNSLLPSVRFPSANIFRTQLLGVSLLTLITLTLTILFYCCRVLNPVFNMILNLGLSVLWALSWSLLTWNMSGTLTHTCNTENWGDASGTMVCRLYKALFTCALVGL